MATISTTSTNTDVAGGSSDTGSSTACLEITAEQEFCLYELEATDSTSIGLVLRAIYDTGDVHKFSRALEKRITHYDKNILRVCTYHYQGFLDSIKQLSNLKEKCNEIKRITEETNEHIQQDSKELLKKTMEIVRYKRLQRNANLAIDQISMCLPALEHYASLQKLMENKKYLQALKVLKDIEYNYLELLQKYRFAHFLIDSIEPIRNEIRTKSYSELTDFLENLQKVSQQIGEDASRHIAKKSQMFGISNSLNPADELSKSTSVDDIQIFYDGSVAKKAIETVVAKKTDENHEPDLSAQDRIDYGPIYRCYQIFNVLCDKERFEVYYRKQRCEQAAVLIQMPIKADSIHAYVRYLDEIIGFFVVEDHIMQCQPSLVTATHKDELWEMALERVTKTMDSHFGNCVDVEMMLKMKKVILLFILTMKSYGYNTSRLYSLLQNFRNQYNTILMREYCAQFENALKIDNYTPITVRNEAEYKAIIEEFPFFKRSLEREGYPRKFPFSQFVPTVYTQAKGYLLSCLRFMENLQLSQSDVHETVGENANMLLTHWTGSLRAFLSSKKRSLVQLVQITINMGYLERSCEHLEHYISKIVHQNDGVMESGHIVSLKTQVLRDTRSDVEQLIDVALTEKVSVILDDANYDWELQQSSGTASDYITVLISFLNTTFTSFTNLPNVLARHVCMQICKYLADRLHRMLVGTPDVRAVSPGALEQFSLDVMQCELFTSTCPVAGFDDNALTETFKHVRQLLDLGMSNDWSTYLAERGGKERNGKYARVKASNATALLERLIEYEKKNSGFFGINRGDRKRLFDTILKRLKTLND